MKKLTFSILFFVFVSGIFGQSYIPMLLEGNQWNIMRTDDTFGPGHTEPTWTTNTFSLFEIPIGNEKYYLFRSSAGGEFLLREDTITKKVFLIDEIAGNHEEKLLYDFGMEIGDTLVYYWNSNEIQFTLRLDSIKNIQFENGNQTRAYYLGIKAPWSNEGFHGAMIWIEGMGAISEFYYPRCIYIVGCEIYNTLLCFNKNDEVYYSNPNFDSCFEEYLKLDEFDKDYMILKPNPVDSELIIETDLGIKEVKIFDIHGKLMKISNSEIINAYDLNYGLYFAKVYFSNDKIAIGKFVKQ